MNDYIQTLLILCPMIFMAGFIDSIAGGGGLISLPAYVLAGLPAHYAYGTNKLSSTPGTLFSVIRFVKGKRVNFKAALTSAAAALVGSYGGARLALALDDRYLRYCLMVLLPVIAVFMLARKNFGENGGVQAAGGARLLVLSAVIGLAIGAYDGFFGPGTGSFLILAYTALAGFDITTASGNAKIVNLSSNIAALAAFIAGGKVMFAVGAPAALFGIMGNWLGSGLALKNGSKVIRPVFICVIILLFLKIGYDFIAA